MSWRHSATCNRLERLDLRAAPWLFAAMVAPRYLIEHAPNKLPEISPN
jgi:hypothetical protein